VLLFEVIWYWIIHVTWNTKTIGHRRSIIDEFPYTLKPSAMPGKQCDNRESRAWFYFPDAVTMSSMHRRRRNESVSIKKCLPANVKKLKDRRCIAGSSRLYGDMLTIIWKPALKQKRMFLKMERAWPKTSFKVSPQRFFKVLPLSFFSSLGRKSFVSNLDWLTALITCKFLMLD